MPIEQQVIDEDCLSDAVDALCRQLADASKQFTDLYGFGNFTAEFRLKRQIDAIVQTIPQEHQCAAALFARMLHVSTATSTKAGERPTNDQ